MSEPEGQGTCWGCGSAGDLDPETELCPRCAMADTAPAPPEEPADATAEPVPEPDEPGPEDEPDDGPEEEGGDEEDDDPDDSGAYCEDPPRQGQDGAIVSEPIVEPDDLRPGHLIERKTRRGWKRGKRAAARRLRERLADRLPALRKYVAAYCRVSTKDQDLQMQVDAIQRTAANATPPDVIDRWYSDVASGVKERPNLNALLRDAANGRLTCVYFYAIDRMGRSLQDIIGKMYFLKRLNVNVVVCREKVDLSDPMGVFAFHVLCAVAQMERDLISKRCREGIATTRARGGMRGPPRMEITKPTRDKVIAHLEKTLAETGRWDWTTALAMVNAGGRIRTDHGTWVRRPMSQATLRNNWDRWARDGLCKPRPRTGPAIFYNGKMRPQQEVPPEFRAAWAERVARKKAERAGLERLTALTPMEKEAIPAELQIEDVTRDQIRMVRREDKAEREDAAWSPEPPETTRENRKP